MNTALTNFWKEINNRISSPLFASFVISWLIYNYKVPIGLIFYKQSELWPDYVSYIDLVSSHTKYTNCLIPLFFALLYTFVYPFLKDFIVVYNSRIDIKTGQKLISHKMDTNMPFDVYQEEADKVDQLKIKYSSLVKDKSKTEDERNSLKTQISLLQIDADKKNNEHTLSINDLQRNHALTISDLEKKESLRIEQLNSDHEDKLADKDFAISKIEERSLQMMRRISAFEIENKKLKNEIENLHLDYAQKLAAAELTFENKTSSTERTHQALIKEMNFVTTNKINDLKQQHAIAVSQLDESQAVHIQIEKDYKQKTDYLLDELKTKDEIISNRDSEFEIIKSQFEKIQTDLSRFENNNIECVKSLERAFLISENMKMHYENDPRIQGFAQDIISEINHARDSAQDFFP